MIAKKVTSTFAEHVWKRRKRKKEEEAEVERKKRVNTSGEPDGGATFERINTRVTPDHDGVPYFPSSSFRFPNHNAASKNLRFSPPLSSGIIIDRGILLLLQLNTDRVEITRRITFERAAAFGIHCCGNTKNWSSNKS